MYVIVKCCRHIDFFCSPLFYVEIEYLLNDGSILCKCIDIKNESQQTLHVNVNITPQSYLSNIVYIGQHGIAIFICQLISEKKASLLGPIVNIKFLLKYIRIFYFKITKKYMYIQKKHFLFMC